MSGVPLYEALKSSYEPLDKAKEKLIPYGYVLIKKLSSHNQQVYFNPKTKKLLYTIAGTHNLKDVGTDVYLALGKLKDTNRFKEAKDILNKAKKEFPSNTGIDIAGHSLGGSISQYLSSDPKVKIYTYDKGATIGQKNKPNEAAYRTVGDVVSLLSSNNPNIKTLERRVANLRGAVTQEQKPTFFKSHNLENLKHSNIMIGESKEKSRPVYNPNEGDSVAFQNYSLND